MPEGTEKVPEIGLARPSTRGKSAAPPQRTAPRGAVATWRPLRWTCCRWGTGPALDQKYRMDCFGSFETHHRRCSSGARRRRRRRRRRLLSDACASSWLRTSARCARGTAHDSSFSIHARRGPLPSGATLMDCNTFFSCPNKRVHTRALRSTCRILERQRQRVAGLSPAVNLTPSGVGVVHKHPLLPPRPGVIVFVSFSFRFRFVFVADFASLCHTFTRPNPVGDVTN